MTINVRDKERIRATQATRWFSQWFYAIPRFEYKRAS